MTRQGSLDKVDIVEALVAHLDDTAVEGIGFIAQAGTEGDDGVLFLEIRTDSGDDCSFRLQITKCRLPE